jgi:murein L,D-transpeptidase YcbB/YkuD
MPSRTPRRVWHHRITRRRLGVGPGVVRAAASAGILIAAAPVAAATAAQTPLLSQGSAGSAVSRLQRALQIPLSGRFGASTKHAVIALQRRDGLSVDGIVGPQTWDTLLGVKPTPTAAPAGASSSTGG